MAYTKLHQSILRSTVWLEPHPTRIVWFTLLLVCNKHGEISGTVPGIAHEARVTLDECRIAFEKFLSPDPDSRTPDEEGRRLVPIDGGWQILNYEKYRVEASKDDQRSKTADRVRRYRERQRRASVTDQALQRGGRNGPVTHDRDIAEAEADSDHESVATTITATPSAPSKNGTFRRTEIPADWKPSTTIQGKLKEALPWVTPAIAGLRMVEFRAWAAEMTDPPTAQAQRDRVWLKFMMRTNKADFAEHLPRSFNL